MSDSTKNNFNISVPKGEIGTDSSVVFKIQPSIKKKEEKIQKFRSFNLQPAICHNGIQINNKIFPRATLHQILLEHGLSKTMPYKSFLNGQFYDFDWNPLDYNGPKVWYFQWNGIECSITGNNGVDTTIRVHDMSPEVGEKVMEEIANEMLARYKDPTPQRSMKIFTAQRTISGYQWMEHATRFHRSMDTIYIDPTVKQDLISQLANFFGSAEFYDKFGATWKRVHLFHGPPGSGKTSVVVALASIFNYNIAKLTPGTMDGRDIENLFNTVPAQTFVILEDVDALFVGREATGAVDFSTLLQCMDGVATKRGLVVFMTTNHIQKLDEALKREGRVDYQVEFTLPGPEQLRFALKTLAPQFAHEHEEFLRLNSGISIAGLQKRIFDRIMGKKNTIL